MTERTKKLKAIRDLQRSEPGGLSFERAREAVRNPQTSPEAQEIAALKLKLGFLEAAVARLNERLNHVHVTGKGHAGFGPEQMSFSTTPVNFDLVEIELCEKDVTGQLTGNTLTGKVLAMPGGTLKTSGAVSVLAS